MSFQDNVIIVSQLRFAYHNQNDVLNIEEFLVKRNEHVFLYGPSGSGKTTLLGLLTGVLSGYRGSIRILGHELAQMSTLDRDRFRGEHLGYIFQMFNLIPYLNVLENMVLPCQLNRSRLKRLGNKTPQHCAKELAKHLGIEEILTKQVTEISVGQQQRVAVGRALMGSPEIIIADEPTSALDYDMRTRFLELLFKEAEITNATIMFVSHDRSLQSLFKHTISLATVNDLNY